MIVEKLGFVEKYNEKDWLDDGGYDEYRQQTDVDYSHDEYQLTADDERACLKMLRQYIGDGPAWFVKLLEKGDLNNEKIEEGLSSLNLKIIYMPDDILAVYDDSIAGDDVAADCTIKGGMLVLTEEVDYEYIYIMNESCENRQDKPYTHYIEAKKEAFRTSKSYEDFKTKMNAIEKPTFVG